jgi:hypothetical protein
MIYSYEQFLELLDYYRDNARWERRERKRNMIRRMVPLDYKSRLD